jgi:hypothetical protein
MLLNIGRWAAGEKQAPRAGVYKVEGLAAKLRGVGLDARDITLADRPGVDVIFLAPRELGDGDISQFTDYIAGGGGLVAAAVGWVWQNRNPDRILAADFAGNRLLAPAGIVWTLHDLSPTSAKGFSTATPPAELAHARKALDAAAAFSDRKRTLSAAEFEQFPTP